MVVPSARLPAANKLFPCRPFPVVDLSWRRARAADRLTRAAEDLGFFKVINHGVAVSAAAMATAAAGFFSLPPGDKLAAGPPSPLGYGVRNIGFNGDMGELEYLLLHSHPAHVAMKANSIPNLNAAHFSEVVNEYVKQVRQLAIELLEMLAEGLGLQDTQVFSGMVEDTDNDCLIRFNHYPTPPCLPGTTTAELDDDEVAGNGTASRERVGFGEHSDPQLLSILWSNDVDGLQIRLPSTSDEREVEWVPVPADPTAFYVNIGDLLQVMTNGRLISVRHRAMANSSRSRMSTVFFAAPSLSTRISPLYEMINKSHRPRRYKSFTWGEFKRAMYTLRLGYNRLDLFIAEADDNKEDANFL
ncbi:gibberellin 2-beta-dioxygenase 2-like [Curcuma longa]|uniref:gibberellin 2-beta-dioxygenase 2-like n=1 Tax=Curcuma longa TaxID=136217 RepID=UPI003D9EE5EF